MLPTKQDQFEAIKAVIQSARTSVVDQSVLHALWILFPDSVVAEEFAEQLTRLSDIKATA